MSTLADFHEMLDDAPREPQSNGRAGRIALIVFLVMTFLVLGGSGGYVWWASSAALPAPTVTSQAPVAAPGPAASLVLPSDGEMLMSVEGGEAYLGPDAAGAFASSGGNDPRPIASIAKLITALVILDAHPLDGPTDPGPTIAFTEADTDLYDQFYVQGAVIAKMPDGLTMSLHDSLATMLLPSAANYAVANARWAFGSESAYVRAARSWLSANGLNDTRIVDATGIDDRNTSTPTDLIALGRIAAANPVVASIVGTSSISVEGPGFITNTNDLLGTLGITGMKTGNLGDGTFNLLFTSTLDVGGEGSLNIIGVRLGGETHDSTDADVARLLQSLHDGFHDVSVGTAGEDIGTISTPWGSEAALVLAKNAALRTWSDTPVSVDLDTTTPQNYADGEVVGTVTWTAGPQSAASDVKIKGAIEEPTLWWRLTHPAELG
ncbi:MULTISPECIES: D-alanyl-D-alanine carboxypeptidase family protein [Microbacterium]|uniref:D-alanyl-D-alanine carboxypeptidase family protein n=1 Tax=Microbacterium TaxID=33882 RepID=UPI00278297FF|nr:MULTISPECIES: D-alanyl-D-alanine carboxypeptidase [Microbacterium]MDQ1083768.1 D-alanyl-D-alanine carboxypeptidase (penicillin-binding protein 5/6) [Microbacterium sp. SORGH_AS_0344]MDQ1170954.1 D-alanyl-D-alanine carboxypeptidase (penicillin-binding protein 5/6) [Microbacterium proteolyticum]